MELLNVDPETQQETESKMKELVEMGFAQVEAEAALAMTNMNMVA